MEKRSKWGIGPCVLLALAVLVSTPGMSREPGLSKEDPWESWNRKVFAFNEVVDRYTLKPAARLYRRLTTDFVDDGITRAVENVGEVRNGLNSWLQGDFRAGVGAFSRFGVNATLGVLGFFDPATDMGIPYHRNDFGITLARWGLPSGPYVVLPLLGPATVRSTLGYPVDRAVRLTQHIDPEPDRWLVVTLGLVDTRADLIPMEDLMIGERYTFIRDSWLDQRELLLTGHQAEDDFTNGLDEFEDEDW